MADIGKASGTLGTLRQLGGAFGLALAVAIFAQAVSYASPRAFSQGFVAAIGLAAGMSLLGAVAAIFLRGSILPATGAAAFDRLGRQGIVAMPQEEIVDGRCTHEPRATRGWPCRKADRAALCRAATEAASRLRTDDWFGHRRRGPRPGNIAQGARG